MIPYLLQVIFLPRLSAAALSCLSRLSRSLSAISLSLEQCYDYVTMFSSSLAYLVQVIISPISLIGIPCVGDISHTPLLGYLDLGPRDARLRTAQTYR